jgi:hypothetical protein
VQQHRVNKLLNDICATNTDLLEIYQDNDDSMKQELDSMRGHHMFSSFYEALKNMNESNLRFPVPHIPDSSISSNVQVS